MSRQNGLASTVRAIHMNNAFFGYIRSRRLSLERVDAAIPSGGRRVLVIVENLPVPFDRRVWCEATTLQAAGYVVSVICPKGRGYERSSETIDGVHIYRHPLPLEARGASAYLIEYSAALFWQFLLSFKVAWRHGFDVIHACNPPDLIFILGIFYKVLGGKSFVFDHHDVAPEFYEAKFKRRGIFWRMLVVAERLTFKTADISIATNESYRTVAIQRGNMPPERTFVVRSGPDLDRVKASPSDPRWRHGRQHMVGYVGVVSETEGLDLLLEAIDHVVRTRGRSDIQFVIVGSGPEWQEIVRLSEKMGLSDYVTFTGRVDDPALFSILSTADLCVNPDRVTRFNDISTMNKIMEYMALGKPIVQFDVTEGRLSAQDAALYAKANDPRDFAEKILHLIDAPELRDQMGEYGRSRVHEVLAWPHEQPKLLKAYDALFGLRDKRRSLLQQLRGLVSRRPRTRSR